MQGGQQQVPLGTQRLAAIYPVGGRRAEHRIDCRTFGFIGRSTA